MVGTNSALTVIVGVGLVIVFFTAALPGVFGHVRCPLVWCLVTP